MRVKSPKGIIAVIRVNLYSCHILYSNTIDDKIIVFLPVIVTLILTLCIYLLYLIC